MAAYLKERGFSAHEIWHSSKARACETAVLIASVLDPGAEVLKKEGLEPDDLPDLTVARMEEMKAEDKPVRLLIVSHIPFLPAMVRQLSPQAYSKVDFDEASIICLSGGAQATWGLEWAVSPADLRGSGRE
jgi:phosphohistidine phosphatase SixA